MGGLDNRFTRPYVALWAGGGESFDDADSSSVCGLSARISVSVYLSISDPELNPATYRGLQGAGDQAGLFAPVSVRRVTLDPSADIT